MKKLPDLSCDFPRKSQKGFALVLALSLMSLVFLLVVSLVSLVSTDLNLSELRKQKVLAQTNARMGMMVALGEIQKHLGPDTRISATADILDERVELNREFINKKYDPTQQAIDGIDLNEDNNFNKMPFGQRYWTGVWKNRAKSKGSLSPGTKPLPNPPSTGNAINESIVYDSEFDPHPAVEVAWLVSGNEGYEEGKLAALEGTGSLISRLDYIEIPDAIEKDQRYFNGSQSIYGNEDNAWLDFQYAVKELFSNKDQDSYNPQYYHPLLELPDPDDAQFPNQTVWMLKKPLLKSSYNPESPLDWQNHLSGEPIKVRKTKFEMPDEENGNLSIQNAYAYWVGDEGVKTKVNLSNPVEKDVWDNLSVANEPSLETGFEIKINTNSDELIKSKIQSLGLFSNPEIGEILINSSTDEKSKIDGLAPHYHSLTTDSYGVLADVRTGGLKRDLSSAFEVKDSVWEEDFNAYLYQDRIYYMKNLSFKPDAYANQWNDEGSGAEAPTVDDKNTILAGPRWSVLKDFHNKWEEVGSSGSVSLKESDLLPDKFPRIVGDNNVVFAERPHNPNRELRVGIDELVDYFNHFDNPSIRPEPSNHSFLPKLLEFKFSAVPTWLSTGNEGTLALAMYPSVSFWNPYNFPIKMTDVHIEIPMNVEVVAFNPKEWDLLRQWWLHDETAVVWQHHPPLFPEHYQIPFHATTSTTSQPSQRWPGGGSTYFDVNGNGRWDPGEPRNWVPRPPRPPRGPGGGGGNNNSKPFDIRRNLVFDGNFDIGNIIHPKTRQTFYNFRNGNYSGFPAYKSFNSNGRIPQYHIFRSIRLDNNNLKPTDFITQRHLLLKIGKLELDPGEKSHFVVSGKTDCKWIDPWNKLNNEIRKPKYIQYFGVNLMEGSEEVAEPLICKTEFVQESTEPLSLRFHLGTITGVNRIIKEDFEDDDADRKKSSNYFKPQGIQVFTLNSPINIEAINQADTNQLDLLNDEDNRELILSINKEFGLHVGSGRLDFQSSDVLDDVHNLVDMAQGKLYGNGYRIRWKLPGNADSVVFNQYNLRALVESLQDGYGDNWDLETFNATHYKGKVGRHCGHGGCRPRWQMHGCAEVGYDFEYFNFYPNAARDGEPLDVLEDFDEVNSAPDGFESTTSVPFNFGPNAIVPKAGIHAKNTGFFHDQITLTNDMESTNSAVMFDLPRSPLLSIAQFKHANLNNYSHGPSYVVGNSYASPQVARYKTWARVRALMMEPMGSMDIIGQIRKFRFEIPHPFGSSFDPIRVNLFPWASNWNTEYAAIRDTEAQNEHQNVTLDHSYYANRALFDGYFLSGTDGTDFTRFPPSLEPGEKYKPFRNSRIIPYIRSGDNGDQSDEIWSLTNYDQIIDNSQKSTVASNEDLQYQTLAGDVLLDGAFNINSTSVEAWISQLSALKGLEFHGKSTSGKTPFPRFFDKIAENKWNKTSILDDSEIEELAKNLVKQIKLRGPFLSYADFVNRRIQAGSPEIEGKRNQDLLNYPFTQWPDETRTSSIGLRGPIQAAIADSEINQGGFDFKLTKESMGNPSIPAIPNQRFYNSRFPNSVYARSDMPIVDYQNFKELNYITSEFGLHAINKKLIQNLNSSSEQSQVVYSEPAMPNPSIPTNNLRKPYDYVKSVQSWGLGVEERKEQIPTPPADPYEIPAGTGTYTEDRVQQNMIYYKNTFKNGEAPDNFLAVENVATAANKPGWLMQADVLTPLAPVSSARSDTFTIRVMGENLPTEGQGFSSRAWIELTVQRTPDYVKSDLDAPHHRPHEPFEDANFDGVWNGREEHWLDLNQNSYDREGNDQTNGIEAGPDLPGVGGTGASKLYADGLKSDLKLNEDEWEESLSNADKDISYQGINQRFGRKFKIVKFRWLNEKDV